MERRRRGSACFWLCLFFLSSLLFSSASASDPGRTSHDPYKVLGVKIDAAQEEIKQSYRRLCLANHPDKHVGRSSRERDKRTALFKQVQEAYSKIGDPDARQHYEMQMGMAPRVNRTASCSESKLPSALSRVFSKVVSIRRISLSVLAKKPPIYVQRVKFPLQDLYRGRTDVSLTLKANRWQRWTASLRGGMGLVGLSRTLLVTLSCIRVSMWVSGLLTAILFDIQQEKPPPRTEYQTNLSAGCKGGTRIVFQSTAGKIVFELVEARHERYRRIGNDLHTLLYITKRQAENGCSLDLEALDPSEPPVEVHIAPNQVKQSGDQVIVPRAGWNRKTGGPGNLVVTVIVRPSGWRHEGIRQMTP